MGRGERWTREGARVGKGGEGEDREMGAGDGKGEEKRREMESGSVDDERGEGAERASVRASE